MEDLAQKVITTVAEQLRLDPARIRPGLSFQRDLGVDSVDFMELVMLLEEELGVLLPDEGLPTLKTVADLIAALDYALASPVPGGHDRFRSESSPGSL